MNQVIRKILAPVRFGLALLALLLFAAVADAQEFDTLETTVDHEASTVEDGYSDRGRPDTGTIHLRILPSRIISELKSRDEFWYADSAFNSNRKKDSIKAANNQANNKNKNTTTTTAPEEDQRQPSPIKTSRWLSMPVLVIILVIFAAVLIFMLVKNNVVSSARYKEKIEDEETPEDIFNIPYEKEINKAIADKNYRFAIRLMFLRLLRSMDEKKLIQYTHERTNFDYLMQVFSSRYYKEFFRITRNYEYAWYGKFDITDDAFSTIKSEFDNFQQKLS